ncbi:amidohydrolase [uncultured Pseudokineococcus sp.]|uniref:amidohydrolase family protein n=1 Tax=uncultured Pseudokineococcus sp. TaxID=1642928 RepID=UPI00262B8624|nr:amidohydrolase family protein [uncultured Pseudokineococcus sp.]
MTSTTTPMTTPGTTPVVDAHHHFWRYGEADQSAWRTDAHGSIARDYGPEDLAPELDATGVGVTVLMQSVDEAAENDRLAAYAAGTGSVRGVVGWLPVLDPVAARAELARADTAAWCGVRTLVGRDPLERLADPDVLDLFRELAGRGLVWDVVPITPEQVLAVVGLARAVPELRVVVDHLARPPLDTLGWEPWASNLAALAACPATALKVSVGVDALTAWSGWRADALPRYVAHALEHFGAERLMLASNWPVVLLRAPYGRAWADLRAAVAAAGADEDQMAEVCGGTAVRWYGLDVPDLDGGGVDVARGAGGDRSAGRPR